MQHNSASASAAGTAHTPHAINNKHVFDNPVGPGKATELSTVYLSVMFPALADLQASYLSFLNPGGLFLPQLTHLNPGDRLVLQIRLLWAQQTVVINTAVALLNPADMLNSRPPGIGVVFLQADCKAVQLLGQLHASDGATSSEAMVPEQGVR